MRIAGIQDQIVTLGSADVSPARTTTTNLSIYRRDANAPKTTTDRFLFDTQPYESPPVILSTGRFDGPCLAGWVKKVPFICRKTAPDVTID